MVISLAHKILFFHISKTAGSSISSMLKDICLDPDPSFNKVFLNNIDHNSVRHIKNKLGLQNGDPYPFQHITQTDARPFLQLSNIDTSDFREFIIVRNPYERLKSQIIFQKIYDWFSVDDFLNNLNPNGSEYWFLKQIEYIKDPITKNLQIYKFEELNKLWPFLSNINKHKPFVIQKTNETPNKNAVNIEFTLAQKKRIYQIFKDDFDAFGYECGFPTASTL